MVSGRDSVPQPLGSAEEPDHESPVFCSTGNAARLFRISFLSLAPSHVIFDGALAWVGG